MLANTRAGSLAHVSAIAAAAGVRADAPHAEPADPRRLKPSPPHRRRNPACTPVTLYSITTHICRI